METVFDRFADARAAFGTRTFLCDPGTTEQTFDQAWAAVEALAHQLAAARIGPGHRVALCLDNSPAFFLHLLALNRLGASVVPLSAALTDAERATLLAAARVVAIITGPNHRAKFAHSDAPVALPGEPLPRVTAPATAAPDEAALLFTSGTTGAPKACILPNRYFVRIGCHYASLGGICAFAPGGDRILTPLPVTHMNALACSFMVAVETGSALIGLDRFHASTWWEGVRATRATVIHYLGVMPAILLQHAASPDDRDHAVRFGFGAGVDPVHHAAFEARFGFPLVEAWAMTETGAGAWVTANHEPRHVGTRCFGRATGETHARVVRADGMDADADEVGELLVRAAGDNPRDGFFSGYDVDGAATEAAWADGWFHTGDIVRRDREGSFTFVDRSKNIVRRSGENIAAVEVEGALALQSSVTACAVLPIEDELRGEEVMALIILAPGRSASLATATAIHDHATATIAYHKTPGWIAFVDALPTTGSQKLRRGEIRALGRACVAAGEAFDLRDRKRRR